MERAGRCTIAVEVLFPHLDRPVPHSVLDNDVAGRAHESALLPGHHVPDIPDDCKLGKVDIGRVQLFCDKVTHTGGTHAGVPVRQAVDLRVLPFAGLADVMVYDHDLPLGEPPFLQQVLLPCPEVGEDLERGVGRDLRHGEGLQLPDKNGPDADLLPRDGLRQDRLAGDAVRIDVGDDGYFRCGRNLFCGCLDIIAKTHCILLRSSYT